MCSASGSGNADDQRVALTAATAQRGRSTPPPRRWSSSARCSTIRAPDMPTGWPSAIAPPLTLTGPGSTPSGLRGLDADGREGLVELDEVEVGDRDALLVRRLADRWAGWSWSEESGPATWPEAPISASQVEAELLGLGLAHHDDGAAPSEICEAEPAVMVPSLRTPAAGGEGLDRRVATDALVRGDGDRVALALRDRDRDDLVVEHAVLPGRGRTLVRLGCERVLLLAGELHAGGVASLGQAAHGLVGGLVVQRVVGHRVDERRRRT